MNKKLKGFSSLLLIILISIVSLSIYSLSLNNYQNSRILQNSIYIRQGKYISESYLNYFYNKNLKDMGYKKDLVKHIKSLTNTIEDIFPDLPHEKNIKIDYQAGAMPKLSVTSSVKYMDIKSQYLALIDVFDLIFYQENPVIRMGSLPKDKLDDFYNLKSRYENSDFADYAGDCLYILENEYLLSNSRFNYIFEDKYNEDQNQTKVNPFRRLIVKKRPIIVESNAVFGHKEYQKSPLDLRGIILNKGVIRLESDVKFQGIFVSDGGRLVSNGHTFDMEGILLEFNDGSYPGININYNKEFIGPNLEILPWAYKLRLNRTKQIYTEQ